MPLYRSIYSCCHFQGAVDLFLNNPLYINGLKGRTINYSFSPYIQPPKVQHFILAQIKFHLPFPHHIL